MLKRAVVKETQCPHSEVITIYVSRVETLDCPDDQKQPKIVIDFLDTPIESNSITFTPAEFELFLRALNEVKEPS